MNPLTVGGQKVKPDDIRSRVPSRVVQGLTYRWMESLLKEDLTHTEDIYKGKVDK